MLDDLLDEVYDNIIAGDAPATTQKVQELLAAGHDPTVILDQGMISAMREVGDLYESCQYFVPEMLIAARAMKAGLEILDPYLATSEFEPKGKVILGTVQGDLHDIGKNLVGMMMRGAGFEIVDLGTNIAPQAFVQAVEQQRPQFVGISALLTTTMPGMQAVIEALDNAGLRDQVKVMVGGAPITQEFADSIGADLFANDAASAARQAVSML